jgi:signal recognition particle subunit SRP54
MFKTLLSSIVARHFKKKLTDLTIKEEDITEVLKQIRIALLDADVNLLVVKDFIKNIRQKAIGRVIGKGEDPENVLLGIVKEELIRILGNQQEGVNTQTNLLKILMVGLQGSGKTTSVAKIGNWLKTKHAKKPLLVGLDIYRPAAIEQLRTLANENNIDFFEKGQQNPVITADEALEYAKSNGNDAIIFDTAGRLQTNETLMSELKNIRNKVSPDEILLVVDAMSGQDIVNVANEFESNLNLSGFVITKLDSDAKAGAVLSLIHLLHLPVKFTGTGEKVASLELFYPERMADRILGLGDIMTLAEKVDGVVDENKSKKTFTRMLAGKMDLEDLMEQMEQIKKMGSIGSIFKMLPNAQRFDENQINLVEEKMRV